MKNLEQFKTVELDERELSSINGGEGFWKEVGHVIGRVCGEFVCAVKMVAEAVGFDAVKK